VLTVVSAADAVSEAPPTSVLAVCAFGFASVGTAFLVSAKIWSRRLREGIEPPTPTFFSPNWPPSHPELSRLVGIFSLVFAGLALLGLLLRIFGVW
jgi:hypothetical protein